MLYRVCRILFVAMLVTAVGCPPVASALSIDRPTDLYLESGIDASTSTIRLTLSYTGSGGAGNPVDVRARIAGIELRLQIEKRKSL